MPKMALPEGDTRGRFLRETRISSATFAGFGAVCSLLMALLFPPHEYAGPWDGGRRRGVGRGRRMVARLRRAPALLDRVLPARLPEPFWLTC
jgi:hypothetical protein